MSLFSVSQMIHGPARAPMPPVTHPPFWTVQVAP